MFLLPACTSPEPTVPASTPTVPFAPVEVRVEVLDVLAHGARLLVGLEPAAVPVLRCTSPDEPAEDHVVTGVEAASQALALDGLLADTPWTCTVEAGSSRWEGSFRTGAADPELPALAVTVDRGDAEPGYTLLDHWVHGDEGPHRVLVVDPQGRVRWSFTLDEPTNHDVDVGWVPERGAFLVGGGSGYAPRYVAIDGTTGWVAPGPEGSGWYHHHAEQLPDGTVLALATEDARFEGLDFPSAQVEVRAPATDEVVWAWHAADALTAGDLPAPTSAGQDVWHANAVQLVDDAEGPAALVSFAHVDQLLRVDRSTGRVSWALGPGGDFALVDGGGARLGDEGWFYGQHHPTLDPATGRLLVHDNGVGRPGGLFYSRVVELAVDPVARTATPTWQWGEPGWFEPRYGDADRLPGGHVLIAMGHCACVPELLGHRSAVVEVDPGDDEVVWRLELGSERDGLYRAQRVDGCALFSNRRYCSVR